MSQKSDIDHPTVPSTDTTVEEKLDMIVTYLHRLDRRDRMRTIGAAVHAFIALVPLAVLLLSTWYVYEHGVELLQGMMSQAFEQTTTYSEESLIDRFREFIESER